jgi:protein tyrosine phosphatase
MRKVRFYSSSLTSSRYWPDKIYPEYIASENITVNLIEENVGNDSVITRKLAVFRKNEKPLVVRQVHYQGWPDHGVPTKTKADFEDVLNIFTTFL